MASEFTAIVERDKDWYIAYCAEIPGANGQGRTKKEALASLREAIKLILNATHRVRQTARRSSRRAVFFAPAVPVQR